MLSQEDGPPGVLGFQSCNWPASYRISQIARDEISHEIRLMEALLPYVMITHFGEGFATSDLYQFLAKSASDLLQTSWVLFLHNHRVAKSQLRPQPQREPPINLSNTNLSRVTAALLSQSPKFSPAATSFKGRPLGFRA